MGGATVLCPHSMASLCKTPPRVLDNCKSNKGKTEGLTAGFMNFRFIQFNNVGLISISNPFKLSELKSFSSVTIESMEVKTCWKTTTTFQISHIST